MSRREEVAAVIAAGIVYDPAPAPDERKPRSYPKTRAKPGEVQKILEQSGVTSSTYYRRQAEGRDVTAPPLTGTARAKRALSKSPWRRGLKLARKTK